MSWQHQPFHSKQQEQGWECLYGLQHSYKIQSFNLRLTHKEFHETVSVRDTAVRKDLKENFYHGFLLGLLRFQKNWKVLSNRECGKGYADIVVEIFSEKTAIVIEMKYAEHGDLEAACNEAMRQIEREGYAEGPHLDGMERVIKCAMACHVKNCRAVFV